MILSERLQWQEAALKLRKALFEQHEKDIHNLNWRDHSSANRGGINCPVCELLVETRWCMVSPPTEKM